MKNESLSSDSRMGKKMIIIETSLAPNPDVSSTMPNSL